MRKIFIAIMLIVVTISLTACQSETDSEEKSKAEKFTVQVEFQCKENLLFSRYDVDIFIDDDLIGTLEHGASDSYTLELEEGNHTLTAEKEDESDVDGMAVFSVSENTDLSYQLSLSSDQIEIEKVDKVEPDTSEETKAAVKDKKAEKKDKDKSAKILNKSNCKELASILALKDEFDPSIEKFASKYQGRTIEFDGNVAYVSPHEGYTTRFDYLIYVGDYGESDFSGPYFQFEDVNYYDLNLKGKNVPDTIGAGLNIRIVAKVEEYDPDSGLFKLDPVSVKMR